MLRLLLRNTFCRLGVHLLRRRATSLNTYTSLRWRVIDCRSCGHVISLTQLTEPR